MNIKPIICGFLLITSYGKAEKTYAQTFHQIEERVNPIKDKPSDNTTDSLFRADTISAGQLVTAKKMANLKQAEKLMLYVIAHFEGFKSCAYLDKVGKVWTIGLGNTRRPDGKPVRKGDRIKTEEEALNYVNAHIYEVSPMADDMVKYLPLDKMTDKEIALMGSILYNCGSGILRNKDKSPSALAVAATDYFTTHSEESWKSFSEKYATHCTANHKKNNTLVIRRETELKFFRDIPFTINDNEEGVNLRTTLLGSLYSCKADEEKILGLSENPLVQCRDSIQTAIQKDFTRQQFIHKKRRGGR